MQRLAIFDFCETLVDIQTTDLFVNYVLEKYPTPVNTNLERIRVPLKKAHLLPSYLHKRLRVLQMRGMPTQKLSEISTYFLQTVLLPHENSTLIHQLEKHRAQGDLLILISGGFTPYIEKYAKYRDFHHSLSTNIKNDSHKYLGYIKDKDCMGKNKVKKLKSLLELNNYDLENSTVYSDSLSDKPLFQLVGNPFLVNPHASDIQNTMQKLNFP